MGGNAEEGEALWHNRVWWRGLAFLLDSEESSAQLPEEGSTHLTVAFLFCFLPHWSSALFVKFQLILSRSSLIWCNKRRNILSRFPPPGFTHAFLLGSWAISPPNYSSNSLIETFTHHCRRSTSFSPDAAARQQRLVAVQGNLERGGLGSRGLSLVSLAAESKGGRALG